MTLPYLVVYECQSPRFAVSRHATKEEAIAAGQLVANQTDRVVEIHVDGEPRPRFVVATLCPLRPGPAEWADAHEAKYGRENLDPATRANLDQMRSSRAQLDAERARVEERVQHAQQCREREEARKRSR